MKERPATQHTAAVHAIATWVRERLFHISNPIHGWGVPTLERHHECVDLRDFPKASAAEAKQIVDLLWK